MLPRGRGRTHRDHSNQSAAGPFWAAQLPNQTLMLMTTVRGSPAPRRRWARNFRWMMDNVVGLDRMSLDYGVHILPCPETPAERVNRGDAGGDQKALEQLRPAAVGAGF